MFREVRPDMSSHHFYSVKQKFCLAARVPKTIKLCLVLEKTFGFIKIYIYIEAPSEVKHFFADFAESAFCLALKAYQLNWLALKAEQYPQSIVGTALRIFTDRLQGKSLDISCVVMERNLLQ